MRWLRLDTLNKASRKWSGSSCNLCSQDTLTLSTCHLCQRGNRELMLLPIISSSFAKRFGLTSERPLGKSSTAGNDIFDTILPFPPLGMTRERQHYAPRLFRLVFFGMSLTIDS